ncbi:hypothetical protein DHW03_03295 [Pedobacter yonginense]|uniref:Uncharacterized protein n=1 Tax=Pedobacter yonginense TaxID=651869 RepID=A0A317ESM4_9SPHI|nr:hypothetical protein DHW03_03295 [Pedobacter yonginense]
MYYIKITSEDIDLSKFGSIDYIYLELDGDGFPVREIGFNKNNDLVHKHPSANYKYGTYGIFDMSSFDLGNLESELTAENFEKIWNK